jgi:hypothetical protein
MKSPLSISVFFALIYVIIKLIVFNLGKSVELFVPMILVNIMLILLAALFGLRAWKRKHKNQEDSFLEDLKCTLRNTSMYALLVSGFVFMYYSTIDKDFRDQLAERQFANVTQKDFKEMQKRDPDMLKDKTLDDYKKLKKNEMQLFTSPFMTTTITLMGLMLIGFFYSLLISLAWPRFLNKILM